MSEQQQKLIDGCKRGETRWQKMLYDTYAGKMMAVCMRYCGNDRETAKDLLQEGFIKVFTYMGSFDGRGSLEGWIRRIMVNVALDYVRSADLLREAECIENVKETSAENIDSSTIDRLSAGELMEIIGELPCGFRTVFNLFVIEGYSHKEISEMLDITESTSRSQLTRAKQLLQKRLKDFI